MVAPARFVKRYPALNRAFVAEAVVAIFLPTVLLLISVPAYGLFMVADYLFTTAADHRPIVARLTAVATYFSYFVAVITFWIRAIATAVGKLVKFDILTSVGFLCGIITTVDIFRYFPLPMFVIVTAPPWLTVLHFACLNIRRKNGSLTATAASH
jgi:hypothetical protein